MVSGPSGSGKTTLCRGLSKTDESCAYAVSCTTRPPRSGEEHGRDYYFLTPREFEARAIRGEFLEWATVHGRMYGTLKSAVLEQIRIGRDVLIDLDVQGAALIRKNADPAIAESLVDVFVMVSDRDELLARLNNRGTEDEAELNLRLENALEEMRHWSEYDYTIVSGTPERDLERFRAIIESERCRSARLQPLETPEAHPDLFE